MKSKKGFTLVELIISLALVALVLSLSLNFLLPAIKLPAKAMNEYEVQSSLRLVTQQITSIIRDASATFALYRVNQNNLTAGWNYVIPSTDHTSIIEYKWNGTTHVPRTITSSQTGVTFDLVFSKLNPSNADNLLEFKIEATVNGQTREIKSEVEALNSLQVIDRGSTTYPSNSLAYRNDARPTQISDVQAAITMVLDTSGSMGYRMSGTNDASDTSTDATKHSRLKKLKAEANRLLTGLSANPNIYASIVPFNSQANNPSGMMQVQNNAGTTGNLTKIINNLVANGGTNTGDGLRRAYYILNQYNATITTSTIKNFMIILVDGTTTFSSAHKVNATGSTINSMDYVMGDKSIGDFWITWSSDSKFNMYNKIYADGGYTGLGNSLDSWGTTYVNEIGKLIKNYSVLNNITKEPIVVYVIGFSANSNDYGSLNDIGTSTNAEINPSTNKRYFEANDSLALQTIFEAIQKDINDSLWHIGGPN
jgi:prepilin-type N-terminal cleavage/methylation domain-containing protein